MKFVKCRNRNNFNALKLMYIQKKHYRKRGAMSRLNWGLAKVLKKYGYEEWLKATKSL